MRLRALRFILVMLLCGLTGCSSIPGAGQSHLNGDDKRLSGSTSAHESSVGRKTTMADYESAVQHMEGCLNESNVKLINGGWDPIDHERILLGYNAPGMPIGQLNEITDRCFAANLSVVERQYVEDNESFMSAELMRAVQACLGKKGIPVSGKEKNPQDLVQTVPTEDQRDLLDCVHDRAAELYPTLLAVVFP